MYCRSVRSQVTQGDCRAFHISVVYLMHLQVELGAATRNIDSSPSSPAGTSGGAGSNGGSLRTSGISPLRTGSPVDGGNHSAVGSPRASRNLGDALGNSSRLGNSRRTGTQQQ